MLLALGAVIEVVMAEPSFACSASPPELLAASRAHAPHRNAGLVSIELA